jgi:hypothetical protein
MDDKILITDDGSIGKKLAKVLRDEFPDIEAIKCVDIASCAHKSLEDAILKNDNQSFIQQKMQGKRRIY